MARLPPLGETFDAFVKQAMEIAGPNVCHEWLQDVWRQSDQDVGAAANHVTECRLRHKIRFRPESGGSEGRRSRGSRRSSSAASLRSVQNSTEAPRPSMVGSAWGHDVQDDVVSAARPASNALVGEHERAPANMPEENNGTSECIQVMARFRPMSEAELAKDPDRQSVDFGTDGRSCALAVEQPNMEIEFQFGRVFEPMASQDDVYEAVAPPIVDSAINGINGAIIAYGQTGSGKTHTMMGPRGAKSLIDGNFDDPELGIIPRVLLALQNHAQSSDGAVELTVSYIEIYQEKVKDLLVKLKTGGTEIREDVANGLHLPDVTCMNVETARQAMEIMQLGNKRRTKSETKMNDDSSRSHAIFVVSITNSTDPARRKFSQLYLVDLAGSERADKTGVWGKQLDEAKMINKSLLALGQVIWNLSTGAAHVPYRDSKLTRVLQNAFGGNVRTCLICACSPHPDNANESLSTLRFGSRASRIRNEAKMNVALDAAELKKLLDRSREELDELRRENDCLKQQLAAQQNSPPLKSELHHESQQAYQDCVFSPASRTRSDDQRVVSPRSAANRTEVQVVSAQPVASEMLDASDMADGAASSPQAILDLVARRLFTRELLPSLLCPITRTVMRDPVSATDGNTYERSAIERHMRQAGRMPAASPTTGKMFPSKQLIPNNVLRQLIQSQGNLLPPMEARVSEFARVSIYLLEHVFSFLNGKALGRSQVACADFFAVGTKPVLWAQLVSVELGEATEVKDPRLHFGQYHAQKAAERAQYKPVAVSKGLRLLAPSK